MRRVRPDDGARSVEQVNLERQRPEQALHQAAVGQGQGLVDVGPRYGAQDKAKVSLVLRVRGEPHVHGQAGGFFCERHQPPLFRSGSRRRVLCVLRELGRFFA